MATVDNTNTINLQHLKVKEATTVTLEYRTATETKALEEKCTPREICDKYYDLLTKIYKWFQLEFDFLGRTSTQKQTEIVQDIFWKLHKRNLIFNQSVEQLYSDTCEQ
ncbi:unnamed protein product [Rotaria sp. Silwood2]|nr:unnamed protein product [Rotaria sp. Silwood2]